VNEVGFSMLRPLEHLVVGLALSLAFAAGCSSQREHVNSPSNTPEACRDSAGDDVRMAARTGWAGAKTGVKTGVEGVKTAGRAVGGFVEGGSRGASEEWNAGKRDTRHVANQSAGEVRHEANVPLCPAN
jgi:hypothetical protein